MTKAIDVSSQKIVYHLLIPWNILQYKAKKGYVVKRSDKLTET